MNKRLLLVAEASRQVGWGHLSEVRAVASVLRERGMPVAVIAIGLGAAARDVEWASDYQALTERLVANPPQVIAWSVRTTGWNAAWDALHKANVRHLWIADIADEYPPVDVLVVPTLKPQWRAAPGGMRVCAGPDYFPLDLLGPRDVPPVRSRHRSVLLTLGGTDRTEASLRLVPALAGTPSTVVIGPDFRHRAELARAAAAFGLDAVMAPDGLRELLLAHQVVLSAGGNTLFEAAATGTPALVTWEDPHEATQGAAFAAEGVARVLGRGSDVDIDVVARTIAALLSSDDLEMMSAAGPRTVDGGGANRVADLLIELADGVAA